MILTVLKIEIKNYLIFFSKQPYVLKIIWFEKNIYQKIELILKTISQILYLHC